MRRIGIKGLIMAGCWILVSAVGGYYTFIHQPKKLEHLEKADQVARMKQAELVSLETERASMARMADEAVRKWRARYKVIPDELTTADVVRYLNGLTASGFKNFDITYTGEQRTGDYAVYAFNVSGRAYYTSLYRLVWELENNRSLYRIHGLTLDQIDLVTKDRQRGTDRLDVMVSFSGTVEAYFDGIDGASAPDTMTSPPSEDETITVRRDDQLPPVPLSVLPDVRPVVNPFYPAVMDQIPPNTYDRIDVEQARLLSIVGDKALFQDDAGIRSAHIGEKVYLGQIIEVDPVAGRVVARLNKGGIIDEVVLELEGHEPYRQAIGPARLSPLN